MLEKNILDNRISNEPYPSQTWTEVTRYICIIDRVRSEPVCCFPWNKTIEELEYAITEPQMYFTKNIVLMLNHWCNEDLSIAEFSDKAMRH